MTKSADIEKHIHDKGYELEIKHSLHKKHALHVIAVFVKRDMLIVWAKKKNSRFYEAISLTPDCCFFPSQFLIYNMSKVHYSLEYRIDPTLSTYEIHG